MVNEYYRYDINDFIYDIDIEWCFLSANPNAVHILEENLVKVNWCSLSKNPNAVKILEENLDKIHWGSLFYNPNCIYIIEKNLDKVEWEYLSANPNVVHILEQNMDYIKIYDDVLLKKVYDYKKIWEVNKELNMEIIKIANKPRRFNRLIEHEQFIISQY